MRCDILSQHDYFLFYFPSPGALSRLGRESIHGHSARGEYRLFCLCERYTLVVSHFLILQYVLEDRGAHACAEQGEKNFLIRSSALPDGKYTSARLHPQRTSGAGLSSQVSQFTFCHISKHVCTHLCLYVCDTTYFVPACRWQGRRRQPVPSSHPAGKSVFLFF